MSNAAFVYQNTTGLEYIVLPLVSLASSVLQLLFHPSYYVAAGKAVDAGKGVDGVIGVSEISITVSLVEGPHAVNNNMVRTINLTDINERQQKIIYRK